MKVMRKRSVFKKSKICSLLPDIFEHELRAYLHLTR